MKRKKILLISPFACGLEDKTAYPPLGLLYVAANMGDEWFPDVMVMQSQDFYKHYYDYYGISVHSVAVVKESIRLIKEIIKENQHATIFIGGSAAGLVYEKFRNDKYVIPVMFEAEKFFGGIDVSILDNISFPARHLLPERLIVHHGNVHHTSKPSTTIIATRGCVYNCSFCDRITMGRKFRKRSVGNIMKEIQELVSIYGIKWLRFIDDCMTFDKEWFANFCLEMQGFGIEWTCLSRADCVDEKLLKLMRESGCREIFFGFESGSQKMLDLMNKHIKVEENARAIQLCKDAGITSCAYMMFGFPGEDENTIDETINFLDTAKPDKSRISTFVAVPGTDVWNKPDKYNVRLKDNYEDYWYFDRHDLCLEYDYIGNKTMKKLQDKIMGYYNTSFREEWTKDAQCA